MLGDQSPLASSNPSELPIHLDRRIYRSLRRPAAALAKARRLTRDETQEIQQQSTQRDDYRQELQIALAAHGQKTLTAALESAGKNVAQLRRRTQLDPLIEQLAQNKTDLEHSISGYMERQILPPWMVISLGAIFVLGVILILGGLLLPGSFTGSLGWPMAWLGLLGVGSGVATKYTMERSAAQQLEVSRRQLGLVESQIQQAQTERSELDRTLPKAAGPLAARLQSAEQDLAKLEELLPLDAQRQSVEQASLDADARRTKAKEDYRSALKNWHEALTIYDLPKHLKPRQIKAFFNTTQQLQAIERQLTEAQLQADRRRRELATFSGHLQQIFTAAGIAPQSTIVCEQFRQLRRDLSEQQKCQTQQELLRRKRRKLRRRFHAVAKRLRRLRNRRSRLLRECQSANLADFRRRSEEFSQIAALIAQRDVASNEIALRLASYSAQAGGNQESEIPPLVANSKAEQIAATTRRMSPSTRRNPPQPAPAV